jgi:hypothetical protein
LTIVGAVLNTHWLPTVGVLLLVAELVDLGGGLVDPARSTSRLTSRL